MHFRKSIAVAISGLAAAAALALPTPATAQTGRAEPQLPNIGGSVERMARCGVAENKWSCRYSWGATRGSLTATRTGWTAAFGWVRDDATDGLCVRTVIIWHSADGTVDRDYSPLACPKGTRLNFAKLPGDAPHWTASSFDFYLVGIRPS